MKKYDPIRYYDEFSANYERRRHQGYHLLLDEIESSFLDSAQGGTCLEAGCGTGLILDRVRDRFRRCYGVDLSREMARLALDRGHPVTQASVTELPFPESTFDVVCSFKVLAHVEHIRNAVSELARVTKKDGLLVLEFYNRRSLRGLRWRLKRLIGGERTGSARETDLYTRYDNVQSILSYLPPETKVEAICGAIIFTPLAIAIRIPVLGQFLSFLERKFSRSFMARYAGFVTVVLRRL